MKLDEARMKQATLVARAQTAKTQKEFSSAMSGATSQSAFAKFEKMEKKIEGMEAEAQAFGELSGDLPEDDAFKTMEKDMALEAEMAKLMEKMGGQVIYNLSRSTGGLRNFFPVNIFQYARRRKTQS